MKLIDGFLFLFPSVMSVLWIGGAVWYFWRSEYREGADNSKLNRYREQPVSILIPCFNESKQIVDTVTHALAVSQREFEIIAVDDGSTDETPKILEDMAKRDSRLRVLNLGSNQGKASALRAGAKLARFPILVCVDGDACIDRDAPAWLAGRFLENPDLGAATGNPRIRNRHSILARLQVGEFSAIVGMIKRAQMVLGKLFTVSGVIAAFRKEAVEEVDYWTEDALTEDIDITWKIQRSGWSACFEPLALVWILTPTTWRGLWRQRLRWAMGGAQVMLRNIDVLARPGKSGLRPLMVEMIASVVWCYLLAGVLIFIAIDTTETVLRGHTPALTLGYGSLILTILCLLQFFVGLLMDYRYDHTAWRSMIITPLYPLAFWMLQFATTLVAYPKVISRRRGRPATWISPDRGLR